MIRCANLSVVAAEGNGTLPHKAERIAMEEVRRGLVVYALPAAMPGPEGRV